MKTPLIEALLLATSLSSVLVTRGAETSTNASAVVAVVVGRTITANDIGLSYESNNSPIIPTNSPSSCLTIDPVDKLRNLITSEVAKDYIAKNNLTATEEELREFLTHQDRSMARDKIERQRTLVELEEKLKDPHLYPAERAEAEKYRSTLRSLAEYDKHREVSGVKLNADQFRMVGAPWVESWKFNKSVHEKYGGTVALTKFGPSPTGAISSLIADYEKQGKLKILDASLKSAVWGKLNASPRLVAKPDQIDFTPYWKKSVPAGTQPSRPATPREKLPATAPAMLALAGRVANGESAAFDELFDFGKEIYRQETYRDQERARANIALMRAGFQFLGEQAGKGNTKAWAAITRSFGALNPERRRNQNSHVDSGVSYLFRFAPEAVSLAATKGHVGAIEMLVNYAQWHIPEHWAMKGLEAAAAMGSEKAKAALKRDRDPNAK